MSASSRIGVLTVVATASLLIGVSSGERAHAASAPSPAASSGPRPATVFGPGEQLTYAVSFGHLHVGSGEMSIVGVDTLGEHAGWHATLTVSGGIPFFRVRDTMTSWFDTGTFVSRRFIQHVNEGRYHAKRDFDIDPVAQTYVKNGGAPLATSVDPTDDVSLIYLVRSLPLVDGDRYELNRYFQPDANPVVIRVVRREQITVPAGTYQAILIEPEIKTSGIFSKNGHARLWFSDDSSRILLQMKSSLSFGSINMYLTHATSGPASPASASPPRDTSDHR